MNHVQEVRHGAKHRDGFLEPVGNGDAVVHVVDVGEVVEERVHEHGHQARGHEECVPSVQEFPGGIQVRLLPGLGMIALVAAFELEERMALGPKNPQGTLLQPPPHRRASGIHGEQLVATPQWHIRLRVVPIFRVDVGAKSARAELESVGKSYTLTDIPMPSLEI